MKVYSPAEMAKLLDIKQPTLRKYSIMLEERGYKISRNSQNHRYYSDKDIITLRRIITGRDSGVTLEESVNNVVSIDKNNTYPNAIDNANDRDSNDIQELKEMIQTQSDIIKTLIERLDEQQQQQEKRLDKQQEYIETRLNERDRALTHAMNEMQEARKQLAIAEEKEENNKGFFARLFKSKNKGVKSEKP